MGGGFGAGGGGVCGGVWGVGCLFGGAGGGGGGGGGDEKLILIIKINQLIYPKIYNLYKITIKKSILKN